MAEKKKIGDLLREAGLIDEFQIGRALSHQRNWGGKLGEILVEMNYVTEENVARAIAEKMRIPYVNLFEPELPPEAIKLLRPDLAKKYGVMPVRLEGKSLVVAMTDPMDIEAIDDLRFGTGYTIKPALSLPSEIKIAIQKYYDGAQVAPPPKTADVKMPAVTMPDKMEYIHGRVPGGDSRSVPPVHDDNDETEYGQRYRLEALIALLIEKNVFTRDELVKMIYQKKMGL